MLLRRHSTHSQIQGRRRNSESSWRLGSRGRSDGTAVPAEPPVRCYLFGLESSAMSSREVELLQERGISRIAVQVLQQGGVVFDEHQTAVMLGAGAVQPLEQFISLFQGVNS